MSRQMSKAAAALMRLKEIDKKYTIKRQEGKSESSDKTTTTTTEESPSRKLPFELKINVKIPKVERSQSYSESGSSFGGTDQKKSAELIYKEEDRDYSRDESTIDEAIDVVSSQEEIETGKLYPVDSEPFSKIEDSLPEVDYENDTFEEVSSSTDVSTEEESMSRLGPSLEETGIKQIDIQIETHEKMVEEKSVAVLPREVKQIVELVAPKRIESTSECELGLDEELSRYVKTVPAQTPVCLLKSAKPILSPSKKQEEQSEKSTDAEKMKSEENQRAENEMPKESREKRDWPQKDRIPEVETATPSGMLPENIADATSTLRKLNRDAIDALNRTRRPDATTGTLPMGKGKEKGKAFGRTKTRNSGTLVKDASSRCNEHRSIKGNKSKSRSKVEKKGKKVDEDGANKRMRKQAIILRLEQERRDIRNYLLELEKTRLEFGPGSFPTNVRSFKPLQFPKIAAYAHQGNLEFDSGSRVAVDRLQDRISGIRQWLKDQYILYRDYSSLAQTVNAKYVPASLEDAKKTIRRLQRATI